MESPRTTLFIGHCIYGLTDPDTGEVMYVGYTNNLAARLNQHVCDLPYSAKSTSKKAPWIRKLLAEGKRPGITLLCKCAMHEKAFFEAFWGEIFSSYRPLLNDKKFNKARLAKC